MWKFSTYLHFGRPKPFSSPLSRDGLTRNYAVTTLSADIKLPIKESTFSFKSVALLRPSWSMKPSGKHGQELTETGSQACTQHFTPLGLLGFL